jgi:hypothetical protein
MNNAKKHGKFLPFFAFLAALLLCGPAQALLFRAYLASDGNDANACTLPAPCRLLPAALATVADGGEIWMLDSANFNTMPVNVTKSVTILAIPGAVGSVLAIGGDAFVINTGGVSVTLRNLVLVPFPGGGGTNGINMTAGAALTLEGCLIASMPQSGIFVGTAASVRITDTTIRDNTSYGVYLKDGAKATITRATISGNQISGVYVQGLTAATTTTADVADSTLDANANGLLEVSNNASATVKVSVQGSRIVRNAGAGLHAESTAGAAVTMSASNNIVSNNNSGIEGFTSGTRVWAVGNTVSDNVTGLSNSGALFESVGTNAVRNNGTPTSGVITPIAPM